MYEAQQELIKAIKECRHEEYGSPKMRFRFPDGKTLEYAPPWYTPPRKP